MLGFAAISVILVQRQWQFNTAAYTTKLFGYSKMMFLDSDQAYY
jgi:hypothetical protein